MGGAVGSRSTSGGDSSCRAGTGEEADKLEDGAGADEEEEEEEQQDKRRLDSDKET